MMDVLAMRIGYTVMAISGITVTTLGLMGAVYILNKMGWRAWDRMASLYRVESMSYWFRRMQKDGTHSLRKAYEDKSTPATMGDNKE
ncbi:hypothetical protein [Janthinobacterium sp. LB2P10]|uniref:hypothetical protein n=1 Tax=Janthinobacterium sp. LB2P10 TaxID=3424194 RepID=UPI003F1FC76D